MSSKHATMRNFILVMFSIPFFQGVLNAQTPWTRNKAGFYVQTSWQTSPLYQTVFDASAPGNRRTLERTIRENSFQLLAEYGLTDKTTIWSATPVRFQYSGALTNAAIGSTLKQGTLSGLGNMALACRHRFTSGDITFSGQARLDANTGRSNPSTGLNTAFDAWSVSLLFSVGQRRHQWHWFAYSGAGWRGPLNHTLALAGGEAGFKVRKYFLAITSDLVWYVGHDIAQYNTPVQKTALYAPDQSVWTFGARAGYEFNRFSGLFLGMNVPLVGNSITSQASWSAGLFFKWD